MAQTSSNFLKSHFCVTSTHFVHILDCLGLYIFFETDVSPTRNDRFRNGSGSLPLSKAEMLAFQRMLKSNAIWKFSTLRMVAKATAADLKAAASAADPGLWDLSGGVVILRAFLRFISRKIDKDR